VIAGVRIEQREHRGIAASDAADPIEQAVQAGLEFGRLQQHPVDLVEAGHGPHPVFQHPDGPVEIGGDRARRIPRLLDGHAPVFAP